MASISEYLQRPKKTKLNLSSVNYNRTPPFLQSCSKLNQTLMSSSYVLKEIFKHKVRKDIVRNNKKVNHRTFAKSMRLTDRIPFLLRYHKKKTVLFLLMSLLTWHYSLHRTVYNYFLSMRPPHKVLLGMVVQMPPIESTVMEQSMHKLRLDSKTVMVLSQVYYEAEKYLYFGIGRNLMFHVYRNLGLLQKGDEQEMFWQKSTFYKKKNQLASGVGMVEFLEMFEEAFNKKREADKSLTEEEFCKQFLSSVIANVGQIIQWEKEFNVKRQEEYLKNAPGLTEIKRDMICEIMKINPEIPLSELEREVLNKGLHGLNASDKHFYAMVREVWYSMKSLNLIKQLSHPTIGYNLNQKSRLEAELAVVSQQMDHWKEEKNKALANFQNLYGKELL